MEMTNLLKKTFFLVMGIIILLFSNMFLNVAISVVVVFLGFVDFGSVENIGDDFFYD